ncbi:MAG: type II toxin-antitoxin system VapC family toxin [Alphaproteobacteria bacterium]|nr:type II toxin-antitoxin system VapC family toxin [Alphaproteobacteria bacterium]
MMMVLDTNTLVYFFRGDGRVAERLLATAPADIAVPAVVVYELETGIAKSSHAAKRRDQLDRLLGVVSVLPFGVEEAKSAATLRARLEQEGTPIGPIDTLIAGTALAHRGVLVTRNVREFGRVPGLAVQDWTS